MIVIPLERGEMEENLEIKWNERKGPELSNLPVSTCHSFPIHPFPPPFTTLTFTILLPLQLVVSHFHD